MSSYLCMPCVLEQHCLHDENLPMLSRCAQASKMLEQEIDICCAEL